MQYICVEVEGGNYSLTRDLSWDEYYQVFQTGILDGKSLCAIEVTNQFEMNEDPKKRAVRVLLYDFIVEKSRPGDTLAPYRYAGPPADALRQVR